MTLPRLGRWRPKLPAPHVWEGGGRVSSRCRVGARRALGAALGGAGMEEAKREDRRVVEKAARQPRRLAAKPPNEPENPQARGERDVVSRKERAVKL